MENLTSNNMHVTLRSKRLNRAKSIESVCSSINSSVSELLTRSLDLSTGHDIDLLENLKAENQKLSKKLEVAHHEIDNLHLELNQLKNLINQQTQQISSLKNICTTPLKC